jgi:magnesium-transporting ATPase (P-type)
VVRAANDATNAWMWTFGVALAWAAIVVFVGVGMTTTYLLAYYGHVPVLLLQMQTLPVVTVGAAFSSLLLVSLPIRFLGMPRMAWLGIPLAQLMVFAALLVAAALSVWTASPEMLRGFATSDIPTAILTAVAAFAGSRVPLRPSAQQRHSADGKKSESRREA